MTIEEKENFYRNILDNRSWRDSILWAIIHTEPIRKKAIANGHAVDNDLEILRKIWIEKYGYDGMPPD
jgi:hypothetical protein